LSRGKKLFEEILGGEHRYGTFKDIQQKNWNAHTPPQNPDGIGRTDVSRTMLP